MAISKKEQDKLVFMTKRDAQGNIIVTRASGNNGGEIRGSILRTNEGNPYLVAGKGISILSGSNSGYPQAGQVTLEVDLGSITDELKSVIVTSGLSGLVGPQGTPGAAGAAGSTGSEGTAGTDGEQGEQGEQGIGITSIDFNDDATLRIVYGDDDDIVDTGSLLGPQGVGISTIEINIPEDSDNEAYLIFTLDINDEDGIPVTIELPENIKGPRGIGFEIGDNFTTRFSFKSGDQFGTTVAFTGEDCNTEEDTSTYVTIEGDTQGAHAHAYTDHGLFHSTGIAGAHTHDIEIPTSVTTCMPRGEKFQILDGDILMEANTLPQGQGWVPITGVTILDYHALTGFMDLDGDIPFPPTPTGIQNMDAEVRLCVVGSSLIVRPFSSDWPGYDEDDVRHTYIMFRLEEWEEQLDDTTLETWPGAWVATGHTWSELTLDNKLNQIENNFDIDAYVNGGVDMDPLYYAALGSLGSLLATTISSTAYQQWMRPFTTYMTMSTEDFTSLKSKPLRVSAQLFIGGYAYDWESHFDLTDPGFPFETWPEDGDASTRCMLFNSTMYVENRFADTIWLNIHDVFFDIKYTVPDE